MESPHVSICSSELRQIQHSLMRPQNVLATQQVLYTALHRARDTMIITDETLRIQYTNKATERMLGMKIVSKFEKNHVILICFIILSITFYLLLQIHFNNRKKL